jgi:hypothetical protein
MSVPAKQARTLGRRSRPHPATSIAASERRRRGEREAQWRGGQESNPPRSGVAAGGEMALGPAVRRSLSEAKAEADGNRTRPPRIARRTGFEDREGHQSPFASGRDSRGRRKGSGPRLERPI